jgi:hypothetical protein
MANELVQNPEFEIGIDAVIRMGTFAAPNTVKSVQNFFKKFKITTQVGNEDITTFNALDAAKKLCYLLNSTNGGADVLWDKPYGTAYREIGKIIKGRKRVRLEIYPSGVVEGYEKIVATVLIGNRDRDFGNDSADKGSISFDGHGAVTEDVVTADDVTAYEAE